MTCQNYTFPDLIKDAGDTIPFRLEFAGTPEVVQYWPADQQVAANEYCRPLTPNGHAYQAQNAGRTASEEPAWPETLGGTVVDGEVTWVCVESETNGFNLVASPTAVTEPATGLSVDSVTVEEGTSIVGDYAGGEYGQDFDVTFSFTIAGRARKARQRVLIRKK